MELHGEAALTPEQKQQILNDRARILATETTEEDAREETMRIVEFSLAQERYAVEAIFVGGVHQVRHITPIPCTPSFILGVINVHGRIPVKSQCNIWVWMCWSYAKIIPCFRIKNGELIKLSIFQKIFLHIKSPFLLS